ncbi:hypothetical protein J4207_03980 [Candidatus Woesearchaeota archaeon]|nr:hypothetical protein [Candidatus Woesearchaeota archaeon]
MNMLGHCRINAKTFDEIAKPLRDAAKQIGLTRADVQKAIKEVRHAQTNP